MQTILSYFLLPNNILKILFGLFLNSTAIGLRYFNRTNCLFLKINPNNLSTFTFSKSLITFKKLFTSLYEKLDTLVDLVVVDQLALDNRMFQLKNRFLLNYLVRFSDFTQAWVSVNVSPLNVVSSISSFFPNAVWLEREAWDLFGIKFINNPDLRRIFSDYGFRGFPLRKDFPVFGFKEVRYDNQQGSVVYGDVVLFQEEREVSLVNPWIKQYYSKLSLNRFGFFNY